MTDDNHPGGGKLPKTFQQFTERFPELAAAHQQIGQTVDQIGPLDDKTRCLIKIGICVGGGLESALRSHVRRASARARTRARGSAAVEPPGHGAVAHDVHLHKQKTRISIR